MAQNKGKRTEGKTLSEQLPATSEGNQLVQRDIRTVSILGMNMDVALLENDAELDKVTQDYINKLSEGSPTEKLDKCKAVLLAGKGAEKMSLLVGAAIDEIRGDQLWSFAITKVTKADGTKYQSADELIRDLYPAYTVERLKQIHEGYEAYVKWNKTFLECGWTPKGETDSRAVRETESMMRNYLDKKKDLSEGNRNAFRKVAGIAPSDDPLSDKEISLIAREGGADVIRRATAKRKQQITMADSKKERGAKSMAESRQGIKPSYAQLGEAKNEILVALGIKEKPEEKTTTTSANQNVVAPKPEPVNVPKPESLFPEMARMVKGFEQMAKRIADLTKEGKPDLAAYFQGDPRVKGAITQSDYDRLVENASNVALHCTAFADSLKAHWHKQITVAGTTVQTDDKGNVIAADSGQQAAAK